MGNKLCAPLWKKSYRDEDHPWAPKKDSHLLRLWAEIFEVRVEGDEVFWARVSDDVVPVNITCIQDTPETVFQITAYNRHVEKIFDVRLLQPGTKITQASECFVHWRDSRYDNEWGLNFTTPVDARRFRDCCMRVRNSRKTVSNPASPVNRPRRAISTPEELALQDAIDAGFVDDRSPTSVDSQSQKSGHSAVEAVATMPRSRQKNHDARAIYEQGGMRKPQSQPSVYYENTYQTLASVRRVAPAEKMGNSVQTESIYATVSRPRRERQAITEPIYATVRNVRQSDPGDYQSREEIDDNGNERRLSKPELRQFSREPTVIRISASADNEPEYTKYPINDLSNDDLGQIQMKTRENGAKTDSKSPLSPPRKSHSSSSPEWPPPPEPITPLSPDTPAVVSSFDSNTLKKMLRNLPDTASLKNGKNSNRNSACFEQDGNGRSTSSSPIRGSQSGNKAEESPLHSNSGPSSHMDLSGVPPTDGRPPIPVRPSNYIAIDCSDMAGRSAKTRDSYPDSGVSGMETTGSVKSGDSGRSARSIKSATLPPGLGLGYCGPKSTSSGSSGRNSDILHAMHTQHACEVRLLTSSDISDSESESSGGTSDSSIRTMPSESQANFASKSAAVRKAGWLTVKNWLMHKKRRLELAPKRNWKKYWVCLKGTMLLFYCCDEGDHVKEDSVPKHILVIEGGIAQAVPEHPKRECILALSTAFGDAYLLQASNPAELENWINAIHSACASSFARQHGKENTLKLLRSEIQKLENSIDIDIKMKKMAELQLTVVSDPKSKVAIEKQIQQWDENLEKLYIEQYRLRCYMASLQGSDLPNPKTLLTYVSKGTKSSLSRLGVFTVTSFHALVYARTPVTTTTLYSNKKKRGLLSTFKADSVTKIRPRSPRSFSPQSGGHGFKTTESGEHLLVDFCAHGGEEGQEQQMPEATFGDNFIRIQLPNDQSLVLGISDKMSVQEVLEAACNKKQLNSNDCFMMLRLGDDNFKIPEKSAFMENEEYEGIMICQKIMFQIEIARSEKDPDFGMAVEAELAEDTEQEDELCVFISDVIKGGLAHKRGLVAGDEILVINGKVVSDLDMVYVENMLVDIKSLCLTIRSCRLERPVNTTALMQHADVYIDHMVCPPPPSQSRISDKTIGELIVPAPNWVQSEKDEDGQTSPRPHKDVADLSSEQIDNLLQGAEQVTHFCRLLHERPVSDTMNHEDLPPVKVLSDSQKLRKVIMELIETERHYVKDLNCLIERYLEPLKEETFLSGEDIVQLFGNIQEIVQFQKMFLQSLEEAVQLEPNFSILSEPAQFREEDLRRILFSLGGSFLYYANHFKLYSSFCASHSKAQKVLNPSNGGTSDSTQALREFLRARNPKQQHSATLESYLIKPIQRILKYPLLLQQLKQLTHPNTDEHHHLSEALRGMEAVAEHINEMQKIYEEYGNIFDDLLKAYKEANPRAKFDLNVGELQMYGTVTWLNALDELGKIKKGTELLCTVFVFKAGVVLLCQERIKGKKKTKPPPGRPGNQPSPEVVNITLYQTVVPVDQLQVRASQHTDTDRHGFWELVHCKSETEGRPERVLQLASSLAAKNEFMKTMRNIIRESVRRMQLPGHRQSKNKHHHQPQQFTQHPPQGTRRPENLPPVNAMNQPPWTVGKKRGKQLKGELVRHSMDLEDRFAPTNTEQQNNYSGPGPDFRIRSKTFSDLNNMNPEENIHHDPQGSQSTIASERGSTSAKLIHSSNTPSNYASTTNIAKDTLGSPIWKPRHGPPTTTSSKKVVKSPGSNEERTLESAIFAGSAYGDYSNIVYDEKHSSVMLTHPHTPYVDHDHTEC